MSHMLIKGTMHPRFNEILSSDALAFVAELHELSGRLKDDSFTVERMARDNLSVARPGEVIFKFQPYATNVSSPGEAKGVMRQRTARQSP